MGCTSSDPYHFNLANESKICENPPLGNNRLKKVKIIKSKNYNKKYINLNLNLSTVGHKRIIKK
jgi:hypothetical protein